MNSWLPNHFRDVSKRRLVGSLYLKQANCLLQSLIRLIMKLPFRLSVNSLPQIQFLKVRSTLLLWIMRLGTKKATRLIATEKLAEYADIRDKVKFLMLPPYSPDLNPIEQVWRITRRENTHNRFFPDLKTLESTVESAFEAWSKPNTQLASLCSF